MYFPDSCLRNHISVLLFFFLLTRAQDTAPQTIFNLDIFSSQKPCAQWCLAGNFGGCHIDYVGNAIGCQSSNCVGALDNCYCRVDLQSAAESYITACVKTSCTVGDSSIDISSAGSIYNSYCSSKGFPVNAPAATTQAGAQATTTVYVTVYRSSGVAAGGLAYSRVGKSLVLFFLLVYLSDLL